jgi:hypothetical protein
LLSLVLSSGCHRAATSSDDTQSHTETAASEAEDIPITAADVPMPTDYAEAVKRLCEYRDAIREAVSSGHRAKAHRPLDETDIALERLPAIARSSGVPRRDWEPIVEAGDDLGEALGAIHEAIDAGHAPDYLLQAQAIDDALGRLQAIELHRGERDENSPESKP